MTKKNKVTLSSIEDIDNKVKDLKLELSKEKGLLASKTKTSNTEKKKQLRKNIARHLTKKNLLIKNDLKNKVKKK